MAQQPSFDIVSQVDLQEVDNAVNQARKEVAARYDFKGKPASIDLDQKEKTLKLLAADEFHMKSLVDILQSKLVKRGVPLKALRYGAVESASAGSVRQTVTLLVGLTKDDAKRIVALIKERKYRVQAQIMDDQVRVTGKDKDELQDIIAFLRGADLPFAVQFTNFR